MKKLITLLPLLVVLLPTSIPNDKLVYAGGAKIFRYEYLQIAREANQIDSARSLEIARNLIQERYGK